MVKNPSKIGNKAKRAQVYAKFKSQKAAEKKKRKSERLERQEEVEALGEEVQKQNPRTIENTRERDETHIDKDNIDDEIIGDEADDEFAEIFNNDKTPKIMITTRPNCSRKLYAFIGDLMQLIPNALYVSRGTALVKELVKDAIEKGYTHLIVLGEKNKKCNGMLLCHLESGPTAYFKISSFQAGSTLKGHGKPTSHVPEVILNNLTTRLGRRLGRIMSSVFPQNPQLEGRQVVTFHNQRDFIFVRHHRYIYRQEKEKLRARLQELGPRFTMKLRWIQEGTFDSEFGEYEFYYKKGQMDAGFNRRKFLL